MGPVPGRTRRFSFIGVTTGKSAIMRVFPAWAEHLGLGGVEICGHNFPMHAPPESYREVVRVIASDPLELGGLVTTHKIDLFNACRGMFDFVDPYAQLCGEVSLCPNAAASSVPTPRTRLFGAVPRRVREGGLLGGQRRRGDPVRCRRFQPCHQLAPYYRSPTRGPTPAHRRGQPQPGPARVPMRRP